MKHRRPKLVTKLQKATAMEPRPLSAYGGKPDQSAILIFGSLLRDHALVGEKLEALHLDPGEYHGNLQVALSAARRLEQALQDLIDQCEGTPK